MLCHPNNSEMGGTNKWNSYTDLGVARIFYHNFGLIFFSGIGLTISGTNINGLRTNGLDITDWLIHKLGIQIGSNMKV